MLPKAQLFGKFRARKPGLADDFAFLRVVQVLSDLLTRFRQNDCLVITTIEINSMSGAVRIPRRSATNFHISERDCESSRATFHLAFCSGFSSLSGKDLLLCELALFVDSAAVLRV
jgi:hypothetical protein